jgi:8-oxo-dGTP pyrophosphatase MutT (NUDIX family)
MARGEETRRAHLLRQLEHYAAADEREREHHRRTLELVESAADPFARTSFDPGHVTASAFVLAPSRDALLLVFHAKLARWLQPGGHVDPADADVVHAARRETYEETGVGELREVDGGRLFDLDVHPIPARKSEPEHEHFDVRMLFVARNTSIVPASDALDARWFPLEEIDRKSADESVARALLKITKKASPQPPGR